MIGSCILLDLHMPGMDGYETAAKLRADGICVPIITLTADVVSGTREKIIAAGMDGYLTKPFKAEKLKSVINRFLGSEISYSDEVPESDSFFCIEEVLKNLGGNNELLYSVVKKFMVNERYSGKYIEAHINGGRYDTAKNILHDVKGMAGNMCCYRLCDAAEKLHAELINGEYTSLEKFKSVWDSTIKELDGFISAFESRKKSVSDDLPYDSVKKKFIELCSDYDIYAAEWFEKYSDIFRRNMDNRDFAKLSEAVSKYDFDSVLTVFGEVNTDV